MQFQDKELKQTYRKYSVSYQIEIFVVVKSRQFKIPMEVIFFRADYFDTIFRGNPLLRFCLIQ